jgi:hypothetical protein
MNVSDEVSEDENDGLSSGLTIRNHQRLIGVVGLVLPVILWLLAGLRPAWANPWVPLRSVSAYYYTGAVSAFAGMLIALAFFLFTYRGYRNKRERYDRIAAIIAGIAAILVAFFPTDVPNGPALVWWTPRTGMIHLLSAAALFASLIFFCLFLFPMSKKDVTPFSGKWWRNIIYISSGVGMVGCMVWVIMAVRSNAPIFLPEVVALELFAISWLVKGHVDEPIKEAVAVPLRYAQEAVEKVSSAVRGQKGGGRSAPKKDA